MKVYQLIQLLELHADLGAEVHVEGCDCDAPAIGITTTEHGLNTDDELVVFINRQHAEFRPLGEENVGPDLADLLPQRPTLKEVVEAKGYDFEEVRKLLP